MTSFTRADVTLANWRLPPFSSWAFLNVSEIVPCAVIPGLRLPEEPGPGFASFETLTVTGTDGAARPIADFLAQSQTDSLIVMRSGRIVGEWFGAGIDPASPHLVFSVTKSVTALLFGIAFDKGLLSPGDTVARHVPEAAGSAYADATVQNLLDMEVSLDFEENYLDTTGNFHRYRRATGWTPDNAADPAPDLKTLLCGIGKGKIEHGTVHHYRSPNTDMAGIVLERVTGRRYADLAGDWLLRPAGVRRDAMITVDRIGTARTAGGLSIAPRDLARIGDLVRRSGGGIVPESFVASLFAGGNREAWNIGDQSALFAGGSYRSCWYDTRRGELAAIGIHGQWIWIDPATETVVVKQSCQDLPAELTLDHAIIAMFRSIAAA